MADKISTGVPSIKSPQQIVVNSSTNNVTSTQALKDSFKSISSNLSVAQVTKQITPSIKNSDDGAAKLSNSLKDAVRYSKQALSVLEDVIAGDIKPDNVEKLLSEDSKALIQRVPERDRLPVSISEIAGDLQELKDNLTTLFESLKTKSEQSEVYSENRKASEVEVVDLEEAKSKAESTSMRIQFNSKEALSAHTGLTINSVAQLLNSGEAVRV
jgi:hypothetical protein